MNKSKKQKRRTGKIEKNKVPKANSTSKVYDVFSVLDASRKANYLEVSADEDSGMPSAPPWIHFT